MSHLWDVLWKQKNTGGNVDERAVAVVLSLSGELQQHSLTFDVAHGHLDGALASFTDVVLAVVVRDDAVVQDEPARLPA